VPGNLSGEPDPVEERKARYPHARLADRRRERGRKWLY
jgi:hypothetical protein